MTADWVRPSAERTTRAYNSVTGITAYLARGLQGLYDLASDRHGADDRESLTAFVVLGRWMFDSSGNAGRIIELECAGVDVRGNFARVVDLEEARRVFAEEVRVTWSPTERRLPVDARCAACGRGWTLEDAHDFVYDDWEKGDYQHGRCDEVSSRRKEYAFFDEVLRAAGFTCYATREVPNRYDGSPRRPWYEVSTPFGDLTVGWRKRVVNVEWSEDLDVPGLAVGDGVTRGRGMIHAWGREKAVEYLAAIRAAMEAAPSRSPSRGKRDGGGER